MCDRESIAYRAAFFSTFIFILGFLCGQLGGCERPVPQSSKSEIKEKEEQIILEKLERQRKYDRSNEALLGN